MEKTKDKVIFDGDINLKCCGHYKKDKPHKDIGLQKWKYRKRFIVDADFIVIAKNKERADELFSGVANIKNIDFKDNSNLIQSLDLLNAGTTPDGTSKSLDYIQMLAEGGPGIERPPVSIDSGADLYDDDILIQNTKLETLDDFTYESPTSDVTGGETFLYDSDTQKYAVYDSTKTQQSPHKLYTELSKGGSDSRNWNRFIETIETDMAINLDSIDWTNQKEIDSLSFEVVEKYFKNFLATGKFKHRGNMYDIQEQISY